MTLCNPREAPGQASGCWAGSHFLGHTTASLHQCPRTPLMVKALASGHPASPCSSLPQNCPVALLGHGECSPHLTTRHWSHSKLWGQSGTACTAALWCQLLPKHSADPPTSVPRDSKGREALRGRKVPPRGEGEQP